MDERAANPAPSSTSSERARPDGLAWVLFLAIGAGGLAIDLWSKHWAFHTLGQSARVIVIPGILEWQTMLNRGALFGIGGGYTGVFLTASVLALILVGWMFTNVPRRQRLLQLALGAILAGAVGNMFDRAYVQLVDKPYAAGNRGPLWLQHVGEADGLHTLEEYPVGKGGLRITTPTVEREVGFVRDFIKIPTKWWGSTTDIWPWVFNVADMLLVGGVSILAIHLLFERNPKNAEEPGSSPRTELETDAT